MNIQKKVILILLTTLTISPMEKNDNNFTIIHHPATLENFWEWKKQCTKICTSPKKSPLTSEDICNKVNIFCKSERERLTHKNLWLNLDSTTQSPLFFVQKIDFEPTTRITFHGDVHGDIHSFNGFIESLAQQGYMDPDNPFKIKAKDFVILMLGDYTDRGNHGAEVLYAIMHMKLVNPDSFFLVRGNHEDEHYNTVYGFKDELELKFPALCSEWLLSEIKSVYTYLPLAIYLTCGPKSAKNALLCCHGGLEFGFKDTAQLLNDERKNCYIPFQKIYRETILNELPLRFQSCFRYIKDQLLQDNSIKNLDYIGFAWADYAFEPSLTDSAPVTMCAANRLQFPEQLTKYLLVKNSTPQCKIRGIFRAHQHDTLTLPRILNLDKKSSPADAGVAKIWFDTHQQQPLHTLWDGIVCTFSVSPNAGYNQRENCFYNFDSFGILTLANKFDQWHLSMHQINTLSDIESLEENDSPKQSPRLYCPGDHNINYNNDFTEKMIQSAD